MPSKLGLPELNVSLSHECVLFPVFGLGFSAKKIMKQKTKTNGLKISKVKQCGDLTHFFVDVKEKSSFVLKTGMGYSKEVFEKVFSCLLDDDSDHLTHHCNKCAIDNESNRCMQKQVTELF